ncbi:MAG: ATP-binding cassette domain-containing protein [Lachnospiraceae bacterium]
MILKAENLSNERVHKVSFELHKGEILGIGGLVGAGRTELLRLLLGIDPGEGSLQMNGKPVEINSPRDGVHKGIAFLPEDRKDQGLILEQSILQILF